MKRNFLDSLAEFAANKNGGPTVACSAMGEYEDNVIIWVVRNEGFLKGQQDMFNHMADLLSKVSGGGM